MSDKIVRFLHSIGIDNVEDYDMDFEMIGKDRFNPNQWNMVINKLTPWKYPLLRKFQDGLNSITYQYNLRFSYIERADNDNVIHLFNEWYETLYHNILEVSLIGKEPGFIYIEYTSNENKEKFQNVLKDFKDFLNFISYEFVFVEIVKEVTNDISKKEMRIIEKKAANRAEESIKEINNIDKEINDRNDVIEEIENQRKEMAELTEANMLDIMKANAIQMAKERERARLNKRGNYIPFDNIDSINENSGSVDFSGKVFHIDVKEFGNFKKCTIGVEDEFGGAIYVNINESHQFNSEIIKCIQRGTNLRIRGVSYIDQYSKELTIKGHFVDLLPKDEILPEDYPMNRVELHLHTNMSAMDAVTKPIEYCEYAKALGHKAIAITDHGVVQSYPDAQKASKKTGVKILYGAELYLINEKLEYIKNPCNIPLNKANYVVLDLETTGLSCKYNKIIEFGAVKVEHGIVVDTIDILINPKVKLTNKIISITNINDEMLIDKPTIEEAFPQILEFIKDSILVTHNANFDFSFLQENAKRLGYQPLTNPVIDTLALSRYLFPQANRHSLGSLCRNMDIFYDEDSAHRADYDAKVLNDVWQPMIVKLTKENINLTHADLEKLETPKALLKHLHPYHVCVLCKNKEGIKDLFKIISTSHVDYLARVPLVPKKLLNDNRKNLLIGSACFNGEVFETARDYNENVLKSIMSFYDYIEIQPLENYSYLINMEEITEEELLLFINDIVKYAKEINKPVCATGDVHYLTKKEKDFRDVYIFHKGLGGNPHPLNPFSRKKMNKKFENPDQHYRTTKEMLECMSFLGKDVAYEITVTNTNMIADQIEDLKPVPNDHLYTPKIDNCENLLRDLCFSKAHEMYGDPLPELIQKRLDTELNGIISNGYSVTYYIAHKIVKKTNEDGYIVGSRGSVGSSFAATMAGITEVNPLPPHYLCPHCKHFEVTTKSHPNIKSGYDLPDKNCPICGTPMIRDGQDIPFQTFLGFEAEKVPDIDLNFPNDYQAKAHDYTKVLLGSDNVFRAGTIETVKDKTAFMFVKDNLEDQNIDSSHFPKAKIDRLVYGCIEVKKTTGQHPGGIVVIPTDHEVNDFTPIQYPPEGEVSSWKTTHFDFESIHDTILKLDMLGHQDPMALKMMCDLTKININDIPLNDPKVLSIFSCPDALEMKNDFSGAKTGALAIPEFGTNFVRGILESTKPKTFADLVIISGISHGKEVWQGNVENIIKEGKATLQEVIGCRDDIMSYLIEMGVPNKIAFSIMEDVRHGKRLKPEFEEIMKANKVPQYYIDCCNKINYLFPKGHAVAYVTMAVRVGYFKVHYPLVFYAAFFSIRSKQFDIAPMIKGRESIIDRLNELKAKSKSKEDSTSNKEDEQLKTLNVALEMIQRGYKFSNIDIYKSDVKNFIVDEQEKALIPPLITIDGLGESNAQTVIDARKDGPFYSKEDLLRRTKLSQTNVKDLSALGVLDGLNESDQNTLFDF